MNRFTFEELADMSFCYGLAQSNALKAWRITDYSVQEYRRYFEDKICISKDKHD